MIACGAASALALRPPAAAPVAATVPRIAVTSGRRLRLPQPLRIAWRCVELAWQLGPALLTIALLRTPLRANWLRLLVQTLEQCGPVGIKWGQWASTRYDLFEDDICDTLAALVNAAPAHPYSHTEALVRTEFGVAIPDLFCDFSRAPIASGSIGQVHLATLREAHGAFPAGLQVAVKVQHPDLEDRLALDMAILRGAAGLVGSFQSAGLSVADTVGQFATNFYMQLDFRDEASNLHRFNRNFGSSFWAAVVSFPRPVDGLVAGHVLVETFETGESVADYLGREGSHCKVTKWKLNEDGNEWLPAAYEEQAGLTPSGGGPRLLKGPSPVGLGAAKEQQRAPNASEELALRKKIALVGVQSYLKMLIFDNFIHADLHPGNVLVRMEEVGWLARLQRYVLIGQTGHRVPHIVFLDAGLAAQFDPRIYSNVQQFFSAIVQHDGAAFGRTVLGLAPSQPHVADPEAFVREVAAKMDHMKAEMDRGEGRAGDNIRSYMASVRRHRVALDPTVMVALMSMVVLEGWQWRLDPAVSIVGSIATILDRKRSLLGWLVDAVGGGAS